MLVGLSRALLNLGNSGAEIMCKQNRGGTLDDFLEEKGTLEEDQAWAIKEVVVWQLTDAVREHSPSKSRLAVLLGTSRFQVDRLLDPTRDVTLGTLQRAAVDDDVDPRLFDGEGACWPA
jgi:hypothetical protein